MSAPLQVPESLQEQLRSFRQKVWTTKLAEAVLFSIAGLLLAFLTVYLFDRFIDTSRLTRSIIFLVALSMWITIPWSIYRWVLKNRRLEELARLLRKREPHVGDQLLSVIELANNNSEQTRSRTLCAAAIDQVAQTARKRNLNDSAPPTFLKSLASIFAISGAASMLLAILFPAAASNAWARFLSPWKDTPRYTFTAIEPLSEKLVVPHGEATTIPVKLSDDSPWRPTVGQLQMDQLTPIESHLNENLYQFHLPPQMSPSFAKLHIGDYLQNLVIEPKPRPELIKTTATIQLPSYLERTDAVEQDVRSGTLNIVQGSVTTIHATASRALAEATVDGAVVPVRDGEFSSSAIGVDLKPEVVELWWKDPDGLTGSETFRLTLQPTEDEAPTVLSEELPRQAVVLDSEQLNFQVMAADDFGIKKIGLSWKGLEDNQLADTADGEKLLSLGGPTQTSLQVGATFSAEALGIEAQPIELRVWTEDYHPERNRIYGPPHMLYVLTAEQHAVWIANQMSKWHRAAMDVRDKELQLHEENKRLRSLTPEELAEDEMRQELRRQAAAESSNARRLSGLTNIGEKLLRQASRNPEIGVGHLDRWAEMLQILNDIGTNRMPSVADLLDESSKSPALASQSAGNKPSAPSAGQSKSSASTASNQKEDPNASQAPRMPSIVDRESSMQPADGEVAAEEPAKKKGNGSKLTLPGTTLAGPPPKSDGAPDKKTEERSDEPELEQAILEQEDLLAEFERIAEELNTVLANLEGSTLVKRLKAASREQGQVAEKISSTINSMFGRPNKGIAGDRLLLSDLSSVEEKSSQTIAYIMDDLQSYFERRRMNQFKIVLDEMKDSNITDDLRTLAKDIPVVQGLSIAEAEYWSDTLDRWGEDLVDPACSGKCPGCKTSDALPPSLILETLKILESEVNLREETRVAEQARPGIELSIHEKESVRLSNVQGMLQQRTIAVVEAIEALPEGSARFGKEISLLNTVQQVMEEATTILATNDTGSPAIAAETEAIELLLQCKRINPKGGGGGGSAPGSGGTGTTQDSALALLGSGLNQNERRESRDVQQATGESGRAFPEEFRAGLNEYFNRLEQGK